MPRGIAQMAAPITKSEVMPIFLKKCQHHRISVATDRATIIPYQYTVMGPMLNAIGSIPM